MIAFGICIGSIDKFERCALPALRRYAEPDAAIAESEDNASILTAYNEMLDAFGEVEDLEALVLLHEDVEIRDPEFARKIRSVLSDPDVAVAGVVGANGVAGLEWWNGAGVGRCEETRGVIEFPTRSGPVEAVDGLLLVLSPWAVRNLRFDETTFSGFHAYDVDFCFQARAAGKRVEVVDLDVFHHTKGGLGDEVGFRLADAAFRAKWATGPYQVETRCPACDLSLVHGPRHERYHVALCAGCGLGATLPAPTREAHGDGIWVEQYGGHRLAMRPQWMHEAQVRLSWLQLYVPDGRLLEVGSGTGEFCATAAAHGYDAYGVEPSEWAAEQARLIGARVVTSDLGQWVDSPDTRPVDVVAAFHVFEHVHEPKQFLAEARRALGEGGVLALEVPNFDSVHARRKPAQWIEGHWADHVFHYTAKSLAKILTDNGFEVENVITFSTRIYESPAAWAARREAWSDQGFPEPPRDMLRVVARKAAVRSVPEPREPELALAGC